MTTQASCRRRAAVLAVAGVLLLTGCGEQEAGSRAADQHRPTGATAPAAPAETGARQRAASAASASPAPKQAPVPVESVPTVLPPGDPGPDAPSVPDPGRPRGGHGHDEHARTVVPAEAVLDANTVSSVLRGSWTQRAAQPLECAADDAWVGERTVRSDTLDGRVLQTVATYDSAAAADRAVADLADRLHRCGWTAERDPRLGFASAAVSDPDADRTAVLISAEGVTVTLVGSGSATAHGGRWSALLDLALGSSCAAAPEGCH